MRRFVSGTSRANRPSAAWPTKVNQQNRWFLPLELQETSSLPFLAKQSQKKMQKQSLCLLTGFFLTLLISQVSWPQWEWLLLWPRPSPAPGNPFHFLFVCAGPVTNAVITAAPANMFLPDSRPAVPLPRFSRHLSSSEGEGGEMGEVCVRLGLYTQVRDPPWASLKPWAWHSASSSLRWHISSLFDKSVIDYKEFFIFLFRLFSTAATRWRPGTCSRFLPVSGRCSSTLAGWGRGPEFP